MNTYNHEGYSKNDKMVKEFCKRKFGLDISKKVSEDFLTRQISRQLIEFAVNILSLYELCDKANFHCTKKCLSKPCFQRYSCGLAL